MITNPALEDQLRHHYQAKADELRLPPLEFEDLLAHGAPATMIGRSAHVRHRSTALMYAAALVAVACAAGAVLMTNRSPEPAGAPLNSPPTSDTTSLTTQSEQPPATTTGPTGGTAQPSTTAGAPQTQQTDAYVPDVPTSPLDIFADSPEWAERVWNGQEALIATCMEQQGFTYIRRPFDDPGTNLVVKDSGYRKLYGYGVPPTTINTAEWQRFTAQMNDPLWKQAFMGTPNQQAGGCQLEELTTLYPPAGVAVSPDNDALNIALADFDRLHLGTDLRTINDPILATAAADWATCMHQLGYPDAATPDRLASATMGQRPASSGIDQNGQPTASTIAESATPSEVQTALDDWSCQTDVDFVNRWYGHLQTLTAEFMQDNADLIGRILTWKQEVAARADAASAANPPA